MSKRVAVIGCGAVGAASAIELLRRGHHVTVYDVAEPGGEQAASFGNAGWLSVQSIIPPAEPGVWRNVPKYILDPLGPLAIRLGYMPRVTPWLLRYLLSGWTPQKVERTARALNDLIKDAAVLHEQLAIEAGCAQLIERKGLLHVYADREAFAREAFGWDLRRRIGVKFEELDSSALRSRHPQLPKHYGFGVYIPDAGRSRNPGEYVAALAAHALSQGAMFRKEKVIRIAPAGGSRASVVTPVGSTEFDAVVVSAGIRSAQILKTMGERLPLESERGYHVSVPDDMVDYGTAYMASDAKMVVNGMAGFVRAAGQVEFAGVDAAPNWNRAKILAERLSGLYPHLDMSKARFWLGHRPSMPDGIPCIGPSGKSAAVIHAFGHGHVGLVGSARTGRVVSQIISGEATDFDIGPFSASRFT